MPGLGSLSYGNAIVDSSGRFKIGQSIDGIDLVSKIDEVGKIKKKMAEIGRAHV